MSAPEGTPAAAPPGVVDPEGAVADDPVPQKTITLLAVVTCSWLLYTAIDLVLDHRIGFLVSAAVAIATSTACVWAHKRPAAAAACTHAAAALTMAGVVAVSLVTGQTRSPMLWVLVCVPLFTGYLCGSRAAIAWAAACACAVIGIEVWRWRSPIAPEHLIDGAHLAGLIVTSLALLLAFAVATNRAHERQISALRDRKKVIRDLLEQADQRARELSIARDAALAAAKTKGDFVAVMSHEIRTPLNAVLGLAGVLLDAPLAPEQRQIVRMIRSSGDTLLAIVNDILDFSKIEAGRLTLEEVPFDVADCMEDAVDLFAPAAAEKDIDLSCLVTPLVPTRLRGDAARVRQILVNFLSNAVKFTPRGSIEVHADAAPIAGDLDALEVHCWVCDTGVGIPEGRLSELFHAFSQADASTTRRFGGTGLGLAICRSLAEKMGGRVWAESGKGEGSTFHLTFRAHTVFDTQTDAISLTRDGVTVLVVSPRKGTRRSVSARANALGLAAVACADLDELVQALSGAPASIVVADEVAATDALRAALAAAKPAPRVVLLTSAGRGTEALRRLRDTWPRAPIVRLPVRRLFLREALVHLLRGDDEGPPTRDCSDQPLSAELPLRVLVAEDNPVNQRVMQLLLDQLGYRADLVGDGAEAVDAVRARPYDLVLMDMRMPEMDGAEATRRIRREVPADQQPRIVALTANVTPEDRARCQDAGMDDFLTKPIVTAELVRAIQATRPRSATSSEAARPGSNPHLDELRRLTSDTDGLFGQLIDQYLTTASRLVREIEAALERADTSAAAQAAHSLSGSSGQIGIFEVLQHTAAIEKAADQGAVDEARGILPALRSTYQAAVEQLQRAKENV